MKLTSVLKSVVRPVITGVMSESGAWSPLSLPNVLIWNDAPSLTGFVEDDPIDSFTDFTGNGFHAVNTGSNRPIYKASGINGKPSVYGVAPQSAVIANIGALAEWYFWVVLKVVVVGTGEDAPVSWVDFPDAGATWKILEINPTSGEYRLNCAALGFYNSQYSADVTSDLTAGDVNAILVEGGPTYLNISSDVGLYSNHVLSGVGSATGSRSDHNCRLFNRNGNYGQFNGHIGEFGVANGTLSSINRARLWAYLSEKWGTLVP